jgi:predicted amidophosphoribosyltransferase
VLIDDVITTGATMRAAQQTLTEGGARTVLGISIAYQELL